MEWNQKKLEEYITNQIEENLNLDYKAAGSLQRNDNKANEISKDVSAFANSDGGIIIYGIKEDSLNKHLPESIDPINRQEISKEWLEQVIQSRIRPKIEDITIYPIPINNSVDLVVYMVEIPQSTTAHQANDKKYYKRHNFSSEPMYDYEIRDIFNRTKHPKIDLEFWISKKTYKTKSAFPQIPDFSISSTGLPIIKEEEKNIRTDFWLKIRARNSGKILSNYLNAYLIIDSEYLIKENRDKGEKTQIFMDNTIRDVVDFQAGFPSPTPKYGPSRYDPILPMRTLVLETVKLNGEFLDSEKFIEWIVFADNSEPRKGKIKINQIEIIE